MKTIGDFIEGKIRRSEATDVLTVKREGDSDTEFGPLEGLLLSKTGQTAFYKLGLILHDGQRIAYEDLIRVTISAEENHERLVHLIGVHGEKFRLRCSEKGGIVLHATLRWIGNTSLKRQIAR